MSVFNTIASLTFNVLEQPLSEEDRLLLQWKREDPPISQTKYNQLCRILHQKDFDVQRVSMSFQKAQQIEEQLNGRGLSFISEPIPNYRPSIFRHFQTHEVIQLMVGDSKLWNLCLQPVHTEEGVYDSLESGLWWRETEAAVKKEYTGLHDEF